MYIMTFTLKIIACKYPQITAILTDDVGIVTLNPLLLGLVLPVCRSPFVITNIAFRGISSKYDFLASSYTCRINTFFFITKVFFFFMHFTYVQRLVYANRFNKHLILKLYFKYLYILKEVLKTCISTLL